ncbi:MAG: mechanosensitive ion channel family protein [Chloroflexi bacterium]|nr:mechanosensitive ion channel family protein [Chloroflexota bacterium]
MDALDGFRQLIADLDRQGALRIILQLLVILVVTAIALRGSQRTVDGIVRRLFDREATEGTAQQLSAVELAKRRETLETLGGGVIRTLILVIGLLMALQVLTIDIGPAIAGLGIAGIALGLGAQGLVKDYLAGAFILIENQYGRGDVVQIAGVTGTVEDLSLRRTVMRDLDGTVHVVPNGLIGVASNMTRVWARINLDIVIRDTARLDEATATVDRVGREMADDPVWRRRVLSAPKVDRVKGLAAAGVTVKVLGTVGAADRWAAAGEVRRRVAEAFAAEGIEIGG